jgi:predicted glycogen debranching enzyme
MAIVFKSEITKNISETSTREWLETNGLGGWASGTLAGMHTRRYHGLLVAAMHPPVGRLVLLSKMAETIQTPNGNFELDCNNFNGLIHPKGYQYLEKYTQDFCPEFEYLAGGVRLKKSIIMVYGENTTIVKYEVLEADTDFTLKLKPFIAFRDYHWMSKANNDISWSYNFTDHILKLSPYAGMPSLYIKLDNSDFHYSPDWYFNYIYNIELERGQDFKEDLFTYGEFYKKLKKGDVFEMLISTENPAAKDGAKLFDLQIERKKSLLTQLPIQDEFSKILTLAADQFLVKRGENLKTIIAGYHWFSDWGRDTMISLPGICLVTGRFEEAKKILLAFAQAVSRGMIPNRFPDEGEHPEYNTVDATLWYFIAVYEYLSYTKDADFVKNELYPVLKEIIDWHVKGTRYGILMDEDGLLLAGEAGSQLTWMDAKVGNWVVTPRDGKAVEINALWYNSLKIMAQFSASYGESAHYDTMAEKTLNSFNKTFINTENGGLFDFIKGDHKDISIRPNQLFVIRLPFEMVDKKIAANIIKQTEDFLLTPKGLRSISNKDIQYKAHYVGDQLSRDGAYHQGTVWSWLIGAYLTAKIKTEGKNAMPAVKNWLKNFEKHLEEAGIGTVSEIFDGDEPFYSKGCMAQAWGVAEVLRVYLEYVITEPKTVKTSSRKKKEAAI